MITTPYVSLVPRAGLELQETLVSRGFAAGCTTFDKPCHVDWSYFWVLSFLEFIGIKSPSRLFRNIFER
jgi:hypothetical protein